MCFMWSMTGWPAGLRRRRTGSILNDAHASIDGDNTGSNADLGWILTDLKVRDVRDATALVTAYSRALK
jgi:hypothetical protein